MKTLVTVLLSLALVLLPVQSHPQQPPDDLGVFAECVMAVLVVGTCAVAVIGIYKMCRDHPARTNFPPAWTNLIDNFSGPVGCPAPRVVASGYGNGVSLMSSANVSNWGEEYHFDLSVAGGIMTAVASKGGVPLLTNSAPLVSTNGDLVATLDFSALQLTTPWPNRFFKIQ